MAERLEMATMTSKGQGLMKGNGRWYVENAIRASFRETEEEFSGEAKKAGFKDEDEMQQYMKERRKEMGR